MRLKALLISTLVIIIATQCTPVEAPIRISRDDIIPIKMIKKSEILDKILFDDVCASIKEAKQAYFNKKIGAD